MALVPVGFCDGSQDLQSLMYVCCASTMPTLGLEDENNFEDVTKATTLLWFFKICLDKPDLVGWPWTLKQGKSERFEAWEFDRRGCVSFCVGLGWDRWQRMKITARQTLRW